MLATAARYPRCSAESFAARCCATISQVGVAELELSARAPSETRPGLQPGAAAGRAAQFAFQASGANSYIDFAIRGGDDYGATATMRRISEAAGMLRSTVRIWGVPGDPAHDADALHRRRSADPGALPGSASVPAADLQPDLLQRAADHDDGSDHLAAPGPAASSPPPSKRRRPTAATSSTSARRSKRSRPPTSATRPRASTSTSTSPRSRTPKAAPPPAARRPVQPPAGLEVNAAAANGLGTCTAGQIGLAGIANERQLLRYDLPPINFSGSFTVSRDGQSTAQISSTATRRPGPGGDRNPARPRRKHHRRRRLGRLDRHLRRRPGGHRRPPADRHRHRQPEPGHRRHRRRRHLHTRIRRRQHRGAALRRHADRSPECAEVDPRARARQPLPGQRLRQSRGRRRNHARFYRAIFTGDLNGDQTGALRDLVADRHRRRRRHHPGRSAAGARAERRQLRRQRSGHPAVQPRAPQLPRYLEDRHRAGRLAGGARSPRLRQRLPGDSGRKPLRHPARLLHHRRRPGLGPRRQAPRPRRHRSGNGTDERDGHRGPAASLRRPHPRTLQRHPGPASHPGHLWHLRGRDRADPLVGARRRPAPAQRRLHDREGRGEHPCANDQASVPDATRFTAGTLDPSAGIYSPFILKLARPDGSPPARPASTRPCPRGCWPGSPASRTAPTRALAAAAAKSGAAERRSPSCPAASRIGSLDAAAGAGPSPYNLTGAAYLAGPYRGAPLSLALVTPALAGPFDLGTAVVRVALHVDPRHDQGQGHLRPLPEHAAEPAARPALGVDRPRSRLRQEPDLLLPPEFHRRHPDPERLASRSATVASSPSNRSSSWR